MQQLDLARQDQPSCQSIEQGVAGVEPDWRSPSAKSQKHGCKQYEKFCKQRNSAAKQMQEPWRTIEQRMSAFKHSLVHCEVPNSQNE